MGWRGAWGLFFHPELGLTPGRVRPRCWDYFSKLYSCSQRHKAETVLPPTPGRAMAREATRRPDPLDAWMLGLPRPHGLGAASNSTSGFLHLVPVSSWNKRTRMGKTWALPAYTKLGVLGLGPRPGLPLPGGPGPGLDVKGRSSPTRSTVPSGARPAWPRHVIPTRHLDRTAKAQPLVP